jgi:UDP-N-acetylmuramate--alanine ligase
MYKKQAHIHFVGIGGIGMSGIAKILKNQGYRISGCDTDLEQKSVIDLQSQGCVIHKGNNTAHCQDKSIDILVYSSVIKNDYPEILAAQQRGIPTIPRAQMLAELMRMKYSIAIAGAHGKTTTTSLISHILLENHRDPTVIIGGHLKSISTNARLGNGDFLIAEADESDRSLTRLHPTIAVITNIDREHLDVYRDLDDIKETFKQFLDNLPFYGKAIVYHEDPHIQSLLPLKNTQTLTFGFSSEADLYAQDIVLYPDATTFTVWQKCLNRAIGTVTLKMPGMHNVLNTLAAISAGLELDIPFESISNAIESFKGVDRRFTFKGTYKGAELIDDYGHHPVEIHHTLMVARKRSKNKLTVIFQPHRYTRTYHLWNDFVKTLTEHAIDHLLITDIFPSSEAPIEGIDSKRLVREIKEMKPSLDVRYIPFEDDFSSLKSELDSIVNPHDLVLLLGAGKVNKLAEKLQNTNNQ